MTWQETKERMMVEDPKKEVIYEQMTCLRRVDWNVEEIVRHQKNLMDILFLIHDLGTPAQIDFSMELISQIRILLENMEDTAKEKDTSWQAKQAAMMRKQIEDQDDTED